MASTQRTESGKWTSRVYVGTKDGKRQYKRFTADTKKEVERMAHAYSLANEKKKTASNITLREAMHAYINAKDELLSPSTVAGYLRIIEHRFQDIMDVSLGDLTFEDYQIAVNNEAKNLAPKTVENAVGLLTATLAFKKISLPDDLTLPQPEKHEIVIPTDEELRLLCDASEEWGICLPVHLAAYLGLRRSEICCIDLEKDFNINKKTLRINKAVVADKDNKYVSKDTKSFNSTRTVPIPESIFHVVKKAIEEKYVMPTPGALEARFIKMKRLLGLDHITLHSLRHYYASALVVLEVPDFYAMKLMGHSTDRMLKTVYQHIRQDYMDEVSSKMDAFYKSKIANDD